MTSYSYRPRIKPMLWCGVLFALSGAYLMHRASTNNRGLILNGLIELGVDGATRFYGAFAVFSWCIAALALCATVIGLIRGPRLLLNEDSMVVPTGLLFVRYHAMRYADVRRIAEVTIRGQQLLTVAGVSGSVSLLKSQFSSGAEFEEVARQLRARCRLR
jgi:hypothetical protein